MPPFKDENILIIAPGSQTTLAQLGLPESFTPPSHRFPSRMFPAPDGETFEPYKIKTRKKAVPDSNGDTEMGGTGQAKPEEEELYEDMEDEEGAVYPLKEGRITSMPALLALLHHVHNSFSPTLHTPIMLIAQPCWTAKNHEDITCFMFEKFKTPALCILDSALATAYAFSLTSAVVVDVGYEKADVTAITDSQITGRGSVAKSGGEAMTRKLMSSLKDHDFSREMAEQLKRSAICEILPLGTPLPTEAIDEPMSAVVAAPSMANPPSVPSGKSVEATKEPGPETTVAEEDPGQGEAPADDDGVLDVASIVASGKTQEFLAKKEKEKAEKAALRKANKEKDAREAADANKPARLPNSKRPRAIFHYEGARHDEPNSKRQKTPEPTSAIEPTSAVEYISASSLPADGAQPTADAATGSLPGDSGSAPDTANGKREEKRKRPEHGDVTRSKRDIEIGTERFLCCSDGLLDHIVDTIYRTVLSVTDISKRQDAWEAMIICGGGSKVRGFKESLLALLNARYVISPSSATMFTSELPSNMATPSGTGSMTPNAYPGGTPPHAMPTASAVNPLLLAATTASQHGHSAASQYGGSAGPSTMQPQQSGHSAHSQSPTSIKTAVPPTYFPEWKSYEDAVFLGGQVAAKVLFVVDQGTSKGCLTRVEFNEEGPSAIHQIGLVY